MDLSLVRYLILASETGSFAKAASKLGIAQPTFGRYIEKLERDVGVKLLYRHGRGVVLTPEGERFINSIRPVLSQVESIRGTLRNERIPNGTVTVGMSPTKADLFGLPLVMTVRKLYPEVRVNIVCGFTGYIHDWLIDGSLDIALVNDARRSRQIQVDFLAKSGLHFVSAKRLSKHKKSTSVGMSDIAKFPLVLPTKKHGLRVLVDEAAARQGVFLNIAYEMDTISLLKELVLSGEAHTIVPLLVFQKEIQAMTVVTSSLQPRLESVAVVATAYKRPQTPAIRAVTNVLATVIKEISKSTFPSMDTSYEESSGAIQKMKV